MQHQNQQETQLVKKTGQGRGSLNGEFNSVLQITTLEVNIYRCSD